jgi:8-oxo-dGTP pyrophosphatase MutT (NUDIX family)
MTFFFPSGKIDQKDHDVDEDYKIVALKREISEEFREQISCDKFYFLGEITAEPIKIHFYVYLVTDFEGIMPKFTVEDGKKFANLVWIKPEEAKKYFIHDTAFEICNMINKFLTKKTKI